MKNKIYIFTLVIVLILTTPMIVGLAEPITGARAAILIEVDTGRVLFEKNAHEQLPMASTTKIITAITAIDFGNLNDNVVANKIAVYTEGSSIYLELGEKMTLEDMLYGLMLRSGNDSAVAIAEHIGGNVEDFAILMNEKVRQIGANNTNLVTPSGLDAKEHYTTAYDLGLITCYALQNPVFSKIVSTKNIEVNREGATWKRLFKNKNKLLWEYEGADGVKTGYTKKSGRCLVSSATRDGLRLVSVVLNCGPMFEDSQAILDYGFDNFRKYTLYNQNQIIKNVPVEKGYADNIDLIIEKDICLPISQDELDKMKASIQYPKKMEAPIIKGKAYGEIIITINGEEITRGNLIAKKNIDEKSFNKFFNDIIKNWIGNFFTSSIYY